MVWGGTVGVPSGLAVDCAGSHPRCVVARLYPGVGRALVQTWVPVLGVVEVQTHYAQRAFDAYTSEWTKLGEMCVGIVRASRPVEDASRKLR